MFTRKEARKNHLLANLSVREFDHIWPELERVSLAAGQMIQDWGDEIEYVYFPTTSVIALLYPVESGMTVEIGMIGSEGVLGIEIFLGGNMAPSMAVVQNAGTAYRMRAKAFRANCSAASECRDSLLRYTHSLMAQVSHTAVCNRFHSISQRLARWLLETADRVHGNRLELTHEQIGDLLGVRREGISVAAHNLSLSGVIKIRRGTVTILDRPSLESAACECYKAVSGEYAHLLERGISRTSIARRGSGVGVTGSGAGPARKGTAAAA